MLRDALESVTRQTYGNWEAIVVNDGGEDISTIVSSLPKNAAAKITALGSRFPQGQARARNHALAAAQGEIIAFLDDDDLFFPDHLETLVSGLRESGAAFAYTQTAMVEERIVGDDRVDCVRRSMFTEFRYSRALLLVRNVIPTINWGVRRECFENCGAFDETLRCAEDWELLLRFSERIAFHQILKATAEVRVRQDADDCVTKRNRLQPVCELLYRRYPSGGNEMVELGRELFLALIR